MKVCDRCFKVRQLPLKISDCKCRGATNIVEIDDNLVNALQIASSKKYRTKYCCGGHSDHLDFTSMYIWFIHPLTSSPIGWKLENNKHIIRRIIKTKNKNKAIIQKEIDNGIFYLESWLKKLEKRY